MLLPVLRFSSPFLLILLLTTMLLGSCYMCPFILLLQSVAETLGISLLLILLLLLLQFLLLVLLLAPYLILLLHLACTLLA